MKPTTYIITIRGVDDDSVDEINYVLAKLKKFAGLKETGGHAGNAGEVRIDLEIDRKKNSEL